MTVRVLQGDCREVLKTLPAGSARMVCTSPPYYGLRDYGTGTWEGGDPACDHVTLAVGMSDKNTLGPTGHLPSTNAANVGRVRQFRDICGKCGATRTDAQIGLEQSPADYVAALVSVFREVRRVLADDGTVWIVIGDSYCSTAPGTMGDPIHQRGIFAGVSDRRAEGSRKFRPATPHGLKPKDLIGIPWMVAFALQDDGWWLRQDNVWCLSGGTRVYARTQKGEMPMTIKDMVRLDPDTIQLWNGEKWTQVLGWSETPRPDVTYEIELRNGQRIGCTANHEWPTQRGNIRTDALQAAGGLFSPDVISVCRLPEPTNPRQPSALDDEMIGWFVGLYIAEGSQSEGTINIASHTKEEHRFDKLRELTTAFHGTAAVHKTSENGCTVAVNGPMLLGIVDTYVSGRLANDKHLHPRCWQRSDKFLRAVLDGYLSGDGHWDANNHRWRLGFCANDELVADLRTVGGRLGITVRLRRAIHSFGGEEFPGYKGELRFTRSDHPNNRPDGEVVAVRESRARKFWDIGVADEPHLFALASGVLTHNSKGNPMPESVTDRTTRSHEYVFMLTKSASYFYDAKAIAERALQPIGTPRLTGQHKADADGFTHNGHGKSGLGSNQGAEFRNKRSVWEINSQPFIGAHFAVMPEELATICILAGSKPGDTVLDPFGGAGTTGAVAARLGRDGVLIDLNAKYCAMAERRIAGETPPLPWGEAAE